MWKPGTVAVAKTCFGCGDQTVWLDDSLVQPLGEGPVAHAELPGAVKREYDEARSIAAQSPRAAAALLRLAVDKLTADLDGGKYAKLDINKRIGAMVKDGLDSSIQQMLDAARVIGNNAVHPGQLDLNADTTLIDSLFWLINEICDEMVSKPKRLQAIVAKLPRSSLDQIAQRDGNGPPAT